MILLLCLLMLACRTPTNAGAFEYSAQSDAAPSKQPDPEAILKTRTVTLLLHSGRETVSLAVLGYTADGGTLRRDGAAIRRYAEAVAQAYRTDAANATVTATGSFDEPFAYTEAEPGEMPDAEQLAKLLLAIDPTLANQTVSVPFVAVEPTVTAERLQETHALLSEYTTSFAEKTLRKENRVHNIRLAAERINGVVVAPGETFSMNRTIGDRTKANGYRLAGAITNGMSVTEYGGGVCQVSTTLFNAVLMADLEIVERYHHSWPMTYAPIGRDATIATGMKDFRFRNTSSEPVTILAAVDEKAMTVTVRLYGEHSDAFDHIEIVSEQLSRLPAKAAEHILDENLPPGTKEVEREGRRGRTSVTYLDYYAADGTLLRRETAFEDVYPSIGEIAYLSADLYYGTEPDA